MFAEGQVQHFGGIGTGGGFSGRSRTLGRMGEIGDGFG